MKQRMNMKFIPFTLQNAVGGQAAPPYLLEHYAASLVTLQSFDAEVCMIDLQSPYYLC
jgi:hypothetical protein